MASNPNMPKGCGIFLKWGWVLAIIMGIGLFLHWSWSFGGNAEQVVPSQAVSEVSSACWVTIALIAFIVIFLMIRAVGSNS